MKILTVVYNLEKGGTQRAAQVFAEGYKFLNHDSRILSLYGLGSRYFEIKDSIEVFDGINRNNLDLIVKWQPDIVHIHSHGLKSEDINKLIYSLSANVKFIETNVFSRPTPWSYRLDYSFQLSEWCTLLYINRGGDINKSIKVPYPVNIDNFSVVSQSKINDFKKQHNIPLNAFVIGRIGQSFPSKWSYTIIDVFNKLAKEDENIYLVIVNAPKNILKLAKDSTYKSRIIHIESIFGDKNLSIAYSSFDLVFMGVEQGESFGMVIAESILCGTPVISLATPWGDNSQGEVLGNDTGGYIVHNVESAIACIRELKKNKTKIKQLGVIGRESIINRYNYIKVCQLSIDYTISKVSSNVNQKKLRKFCFDQMYNSYGKPSLLTMLFLHIGLKQLTIYSSGYHSWFQLLKRIIRKFNTYTKN